MGYKIDFVVDLVEERVDLGGSQFSESILERWYSAHASQQNVVILEFGSSCSPRVKEWEAFKVPSLFSAAE